MIKNIVFDLGNVLISFKPSEYFDKNNYPENIKTTILSDIFGSKEWLLIDKGEITTSEAINSITSRSSLKKEEIAHIFNLRIDMMYPLDLNVRLLPELKKRSFKLFYLSNFPFDIFDEIRTGYYFFRYFDGGLISSEAKYSKPDNRLYEILLEKYSLIPQECLFVDDIEINVRAAEALGMTGLFTHGSPEIAREIEDTIKNSKGE
jgi:epoxide hydrolase-like predicted phosphatase